MFNFDEFVAGRQGIYADYDNISRLFSYLGNKGIVWSNRQLVGSETLSLDDNESYYLNESGVRRANARCNNNSCASYYVMIDGALHKKVYSYFRNNNIPTWNFENIPNEDEIDAEGFEKEVY